MTARESLTVRIKDSSIHPPYYMSLLKNTMKMYLLLYIFKLTFLKAVASHLGFFVGVLYMARFLTPSHEKPQSMKDEETLAQPGTLEVLLTSNPTLSRCLL